MGKASRRKQTASPAARKDETGYAAAAEPAHGQSLLSRPVGHLLLIGILGFLAYSNTFQGPFQWDEAEYILNNPVIRDLGYFLSPSHVEGSWLYYILKSRYIGYLTFALNYRLHGYDVFGYHLVNLAIHIINAVLVYFFILLTFRTPYFSSEKAGNSQFTAHDSRVVDYSPLTIHYSHFFALAASLLFVAHPIQTEAVTYVFQRLASLVSMFYLLSLVMYIKGRLSAISSRQSAENSRFTIIWYLLSLLSAVLAMKTKENAFTLPVIIALYEFLFFTGQLKTRMLRLLPFFLTMLIIPMTIFGTGSSAGELMSQINDPQALGYQELSRGDYLFTQMRVIVTYIRLLFFPVNENIDYDYPIYQSLFALPVLFSFLFLLALLGAAVWLVYKTRSEKLKVISKKLGDEETAENYSPFTIHLYRLIGFGILWFFITLSVESSIIPIPMVINEYRVYLPSVGFFMALVAGLVLLLKQSSRFTIHNLRFAKVVAALFALVILALASATYARNTLWTDKVSLWEDVVRKSPGSARGYNNLGIAYFNKGMHEQAIEMYERCLALRPSQKDAHVNLGVVYATTRRMDKAIEQFLAAIAIEPGNNGAYFNLARAYTDAGQIDKAAETYLRAIELNPYNSGAYHGLGTSYMKLRRPDDALAAYTKFVELSPRDPEAYRNRGIVYAQKGDFRNAGSDFQQACSLGSRESCEYLNDSRFR